MHRCFVKCVLALGVLAGLLQAATVGGVVTDSVSGSKLDSVRVRLMLGTRAVATDTTNAEGVFSFAGVDTGAYTISATKTNYAGKSVVDTVSTGETDVTVNIAIAAIVKTTVGGTVTDSAAGTPVANAVVRLRQNNQTVARDTTGADGAFSFADVVTGAYTLQVSLDGFATANIDAAVTSAAFTAAIPLIKAVAVNVSGTVTDSAAGTALAGAVVQLLRSTQPFKTDTTDAEGKYSFDSVVTGTYTVRASLAGYAAKTLDASVAAAAVTVAIPLAIVVAAPVTGTVTDSVAGTPLAGVAVALRNTGRTVSLNDTTGADGTYSFDKVETGEYTVRGTLAGYTVKSLPAVVAGATAVTVDLPLAVVVTATVEGVVKDSAAGTVLAGVVVQIRTTAAAVATDTTDAEGKYSFAKIDVGSYTLRATLADYVQKTVAATVATSATVVVEIPLVKTITALVTGTVTDSVAGTKVPGAIVQVRSGNTVVATDTCGTDGVYSFDKVAAGTYTVRVSATGFRSKSVNCTVAGADAVTANVALVAVTFGTIAGKITADSLTGVALAGVTVTLSRSSGTPVDTATTDAEGTYAFDKVETQTAYTIRGSRTGYASKSANLAAKREGVDTVNMFMVAIVTKSIKVTVLKAADSTIIAGANVAFASTVGTIRSGTADASGKALFENVAEGTYSISASAAGFTPLSRQFVLNTASADSVYVYLTAATGGTKILTGTVTDSISGSALANVTVSLRLSGGGSINLAATTGADGVFTIAGIPVASTSVTLSAALAEYRPAAKVVTLGTANTADTTKADFKMISNAAPVIGRRNAPAINGGRPFVEMSTGGRITLYNVTGAGVVKLFGLDGRLIYRCSFIGTGSSGVALRTAQRPNAACILKITRSDGADITGKILRLQK